MKSNNFGLLILLLLFLGCNNSPKQEITETEKPQDNFVIIKQPYKNNPNVTEYEIPVLRGTSIKHGIQKRFYLHGSLYSEIPYINGKREGIAYTYYPAAEDAKPVVWKEQPYVNNTLDGICKRYHRNGELQAEYEYKNGLPSIGLKEFNESGKSEKMPELILNKSKTSIYYLITAQLSKNDNNADYFIGDLVDGKYLPDNLKGLQVVNGKGEILVPLDQKSVTITAVHFTKYQNKYLVSKTISL